MLKMNCLSTTSSPFYQIFLLFFYLFIKIDISNVHPPSSQIILSNLAINSVNSAIAVDLVELRRIPEFLQKNKTKIKTLRAIVEKKKKRSEWTV